MKLTHGGPQYFVDDKYYDKVPFTHHRSLEQLDHSVLQGCHLCTLIANALKVAGFDASNRTGQSGPIQLTWALKQDYSHFYEYIDIRCNEAFAYLRMSDARPNLSFLGNHDAIFRPALIEHHLIGSHLSSLRSPTGKASLSGFPKMTVLGGRTYYRIEQEDLGEV